MMTIKDIKKRLSTSESPIYFVIISAYQVIHEMRQSPVFIS